MMWQELKELSVWVLKKYQGSFQETKVSVYRLKEKILRTNQENTEFITGQ